MCPSDRTDNDSTQLKSEQRPKINKRLFENMNVIAMTHVKKARNPTRTDIPAIGGKGYR